MKRALLTASFLSLGACASGPYINPGLVSVVDGPITATSNTGSSKTGKSCAHNILGIVATGDNSIKTAAQMGGINKISSANYDLFNILGIYTRVCTNVYGE